MTRTGTVAMLEDISQPQSFMNLLDSSHYEAHDILPQSSLQLSRTPSHVSSPSATATSKTSLSPVMNSKSLEEVDQSKFILPNMTTSNSALSNDAVGTVTSQDGDTTPVRSNRGRVLKPTARAQESWAFTSKMSQANSRLEPTSTDSVPSMISPKKPEDAKHALHDGVVEDAKSPINLTSPLSQAQKRQANAKRKREIEDSKTTVTEPKPKKMRKSEAIVAPDDTEISHRPTAKSPVHFTHEQVRPAATNGQRSETAAEPPTISTTKPTRIRLKLKQDKTRDVESALSGSVAQTARLGQSQPQTQPRPAGKEPERLQKRLPAPDPPSPMTEPIHNTRRRKPPATSADTTSNTSPSSIQKEFVTASNKRIISAGSAKASLMHELPKTSQIDTLTCQATCLDEIDYLTAMTQIALEVEDLTTDDCARKLADFCQCKFNECKKLRSAKSRRTTRNAMNDEDGIEEKPQETKVTSLAVSRRQGREERKRKL